MLGLVSVLATFALTQAAKKSDGYHTTYACEGNTLRLACAEGKLHLVRANFGRFSISICNDNGNLDWRVNCMSHHSFLIMRERCELQPSCSVHVSSSTFHDPCPGTRKYLEVQYHCGTGPLLLTTSSTTPVQIPINVTAVPIGKIHTVTQRSTTTTALPTHPTAHSTTHPTAHSTTQPTTFPTTHPTTQSEPTIQPTIEPLHTETYIDITKVSCPPVHSRGIDWPRLEAGETASVPCPEGAGGTARWHCEDNPVRWNAEDPDLMQCYSLWLQNLKDRIQNGDSIISAVSEVAVMSAAKPVFSRDLKDIREVIEKAFYKSLNGKDNFLDMWHRYHVLRELLTFSVHTLNNLLDKKQEAAWKELQLDDAKKVLSTFLEKIDSSALLLSETSSDDSRFSLVKRNIWLSLQVIKASSPAPLMFPLFSDISAAEEDRAYWLDMKDSLLLPQSAIQSWEKNGLYKVVYIAFNKIHNFLKPGFNISSENVSRIINSRMIGASLDRKGDIKLNQPAVITLKHLIEINVTNPVCVFWDIHLKDWSSEGCWLKSSNKTHTTCLCDHLTNFALIMDLKTMLFSKPNTNWMHTVMAAGCVIAIISLTITVLFLYFRLSLPESFLHRNLFLCVLMSEIAFVVGMKHTSPRIICSLLAGTLQYQLLVTCCWLFLECYHQYATLTHWPRKSGWYYATAYTIPGLITGISAAVHPASYGTDHFCWLQADNYFVLTFVGPAVSTIFGGLVFLCLSFFTLCHNVTLKETDDLLKYRTCNRRSFVLMGLFSVTWTSALVWINAQTMELAFSFSISNSVLGVTVLSLYCFKNEKIDLRSLLRLEVFFKQRKQTEPHGSGTSDSTLENDAREFWTLPKGNISSSQTNVTKDSAQSSLVLSRNSSWMETKYGVKSDLGSRSQDGEDHIYESIDDVAFQAENCLDSSSYGLHSMGRQPMFRRHQSSNSLTLRASCGIQNSSSEVCCDSPGDNSVMLAVLDGGKVVNRIQQEDVFIKSQYSTYC